MFREFKLLTKNWGVYGFGVVLSKAVGFFMFPLYTHALTPADYGVLELLDLLIFFVSIFSALGIHSAVFRFYAAAGSEGDKKQVIGTAYLFFALSSLCFSLMIWLFAPWIAGVLLGKRDMAGLIKVVACTLFCLNISEVPLAYIRASNRTARFVAISVARTIIGASTLAFFLVGLKWGLKGAVYANCTSAVIVSVGLCAALRGIPIRIAVDRLRPMIAYGAPLIAQSAGSFVLVFSDRFFLRHYGTLTEVGIYSLSYKLAGLLAVFISGPFDMAWQSQQFDVAKNKDAPEIYARVQIYQVLLGLFFTLILSLLAKDVLRVLSPASYWSAALYVPILTLSYLFAQMRSVVFSPFYTQNKTSIIANLSISVALLNILLNFALIPRYKILGAALATVLSYLISLGLAIFASRKLVYIPYDYVRIMALFVWASIFYGVSRLLGLPSIFLSISLNSALILLFLPSAYLLLSREEREFVRTAFGKATGTLGLRKHAATT